MIQKIAITLVFASVLGASFGQTAEPATKTGTPDIPGTFVVEYGFNRDLTGPDNFSLRFWGSRTVNVYYQYDIRILKSKFSFVPGIGLSLERYGFKNGRTLAYDYKDSLVLANVGDSLHMYRGIKKNGSKLITNFIDVPLELRFNSNPDDPARSFRAAIGGRFGYLFDSFTKVKYEQDGETKKIKDKQDFNLTKFRYGVSARVGYGNFTVFAYYNLNTLFEKGKGPYTATQKTDFPTGTIGISFSSF